ncbi:MAG: DUF1003 domain-containing protein [Abitibacteriaceae bacterium]|nr:DUF1003 domain-containing protein [Abditibacteriaceae bacterium]
MIDLAALKQIPIFSAMDDEELAGIRSIMDEETFIPGEIIISEEGSCDYFYVVLQGEAKVFVHDASGQEVLLDEIEPGEYFGDLPLLTGEPSSSHVQAKSEVVALALDRNEFLAFLREHPDAAIDVLTVLGRRLNRTDKRIRESVVRNVNDVLEEKLTTGQRIADAFAATMGSWRFIIVQSILLIAWVTLNVTHFIKNWDPYPFILLNLALSFQAAYAAPIIMMSQNRQSDKDRLTAEIDHDVNTRAESEIGLILRKLDGIDSHLERMSKDTVSTNGVGK